MARNKNNLPKILGIIGVLVVILALSGMGAFFLLRNGNGLAKLPAFPVEKYLDGGNLWGYEDYKLEGKVDNVLQRSNNKDAILASIQPENSKRRLPVIIQKSEGMKPVLREQKLILKVTLGDSHEIYCKEYYSQ